ncbi:aminoglycoside 6'-N-acetyltransferase [Usitatibacter rugosus]
MIERCTSIKHRGWLELRRELWPSGGDAEHVPEMEAICSNPDRLCAFVAYDDEARPSGFVEASGRTDYVNGTDSSPVGFIEGIYVIANARRRGTGRALLQAAETWARTIGCREMASDAHVENEMSHTFHRALGFIETERVVFFRKDLDANN